MMVLGARDSSPRLANYNNNEPNTDITSHISGSSQPRMPIQLFIHLSRNPST